MDITATQRIDKAFPGVKALSGAALNVIWPRYSWWGSAPEIHHDESISHLCGAGSLLWLGKGATFNGPKSSQEAGIGIIHQELNLIRS